MKTIYIVMEVEKNSRQEGWISGVFETYKNAYDYSERMKQECEYDLLYKIHQWEVR